MTQLKQKIILNSKAKIKTKKLHIIRFNDNVNKSYFAKIIT